MRTKESVVDAAKQHDEAAAVPSAQAGTARAAAGEAVQELGDALLELAKTNADLAWSLARFTTVIVTEAARSPRFARTIANAAQIPNGRGRTETGASDRHRGRRAPGPFDPFAVYAEIGEEGLRERLNVLPVEQLRNIVAEHRMDHDRLAMKWKDPARLVERIVELVKTRSVKGDVFRSS